MLAPIQRRLPRVSTQGLTCEVLMQHAKARGATAGLHGVDDEFASWVEPQLQRLGIMLHGALGPEPELLLKQRSTRETELEQVVETRGAYTTKRLLDMEHVYTPAPLNLRLAAGVTLGCGLAGLTASALGLAMSWPHWATLGVLATSLTLVLQALPRWLSNAQYYLTLYTFQRRITRLERMIERLNAAAWSAMERRSQHEQFVGVHKQLLVSTFEYYRAAGAITATQQAQYTTMD